jgi:1-acyl-sn-glycerol-3-phosphate acyltransferase
MTHYADSLDRRDPAFIARIYPAMAAFAKHYLHLRVEGLEHTPKGPVIFVGNHNGGILGPDLSCTLSTLWGALTVASPLYALAHDFAMRQLTPLGRVLSRLGAIAASRSNAHRVLESGGQVLVYPGGDLDAYRAFEHRNRVIILPRTGFVEVARKAGAPIVPIVAHGAHRSAYIFSDGRAIARALRMQHWARLERFPLALALPWGFVAGPWLPYFPLPFPIRLRVLPPIHVRADEDARDVAHDVQTQMQIALSDLSQ